MFIKVNWSNTWTVMMFKKQCKCVCTVENGLQAGYVILGKVKERTVCIMGFLPLY